MTRHLQLLGVGKGAFTVVEHDGVTHIGVIGNLVVDNRAEFVELVTASLQAGARAFLFDMSRSAYIDASGLGALVRTHKDVRRSDGTVRITGLSDDLHTLFELTGLAKVFGLEARRPQRT